MPATACVRSREEQQREDRHARAPADPNINIRQVYDQRYADAEVHYDALGNLAGFFGRNMPAHRHDRFFRVHYVKNGAVRVLSRRAPVPGVRADVLPHPADRAARLRHRGGRRWPCADRAPATGVEPHRGRAGLAPGPQVAPACVALGNLEGGAAEEAARLALLFEQLRSESMASRPGRQQTLLALTRLVMIGLLRLSANSVAARLMRHEPADLPALQRADRGSAMPSTGRCRSTPAGSASPSAPQRRLPAHRRPAVEAPGVRTAYAGVKRLLLFTGGSVNEICYQLGFKDPAYFSRFFVRYAGLTPSAYRQRQADGESRR